MATRQKLKDEFLTCIICHEVFRDPVTLHCGHTLCAQCVTAFTKTQKQAIAEKSIICPHCRGLTKAPDPTRQVEEWAGQIKTGFFVKGLVEAVVTDKKDDLDDLCTPCQEDGETVPAVVWCYQCEHGLCSGCERYHRKIPVSKNHELIHLSEGNRHTLQRARKRYPCPKHPDAFIDMMCEDCDVAVCHRCCILHHRKCESVIPLEECLPRLKSVIEAQGKELDDIVKQVSAKLSLKNSQVKDVEKEARDAIIAIDVSGEKIIAEVREQQKQLKEQVKQTKEDVLQSLKADIKSGEMRLEEAQQREGFIKEAMKSDVLMNYYEMYKICKPSGVTHVGDSTSDSRKPTQIHIKVNDSSNEVVSFLREKSFADVKVSGHRAAPIGTTSRPNLVRKLDTGLTFVWDGLVVKIKGMKTMIVSCRTGCSVTSFYQQGQKQCRSRLNLNGTPLNVTQVSDDKCAVAVDSSKEIEVFRVTPDRKRDKTIKTSKGYHGLIYLKSSHFAASTERPGVIDIIDMSGTILRAFESGLFQTPLYLSTIIDTIIVSDYAGKTVTGITDTGAVTFKYPQTNDKKLERPFGITSTSSKEIFVADETANTVIQLTDTGKYVRDVLSAADGLSYPRALFVDDDNLMYVCVDFTTIHVYEFK